MVSGNGMVARPMEAHWSARHRDRRLLGAGRVRHGVRSDGHRGRRRHHHSSHQQLRHRHLGRHGRAGNGPAQAVPGAAATRPKPRALALPATARPGDHGKGVAALQRQLATLGYEVRKVDGQYGSATQHAVVAFQKVNHLSRDGIAGPKTMKALAHPRRPRPRLGGSGLHVEADLTLQVIYIVSSGRIQQILDASSASGRTYLSHGSVRRAHTPEGSFRIGRKVNGWHRSYLGLMYRPAYFDGPYAIHGAPNVPPYPASHGCIRVTTASMDAIYSKLVPGTRVLVYRT